MSSAASLLETNPYPPKHNGQHMIEVDADPDVNLIDVCAARAGITSEQAAIVLQTQDEMRDSGGRASDELEPQDDAVTAALRERDKQWSWWLGKIFFILTAQTNIQKERKFVRMSEMTMMYALGFGSMIGIRTFEDIANRLGLALGNRQSGKQTVRECCEKFLDQLKLAPMLTQRTAEARAEMSRSRVDQLAKN